jgi:hypothetical protein
MFSVHWSPIRTVKTATPAANRFCGKWEAEYDIRQVRKVGAEKPMGYCLVSQVEASLGPDAVEILTRTAKECGLETLTHPRRAPFNHENLLFYYHPQSLTELLDANRGVLLDAGWPTDPVGFCTHVAAITAPAKTPLFDLIADAFADPFNTGRLKKGILKMTDL